MAGGIDVSVTANKAKLIFTEQVRGLDLTVSYRADLLPVDVKIDGAMVEWMADGNRLRIAAASEAEFSKVTVEFSELVPTRSAA